MLHVTTDNFNSTVASRDQLLVAFYDAKSQSFAELRGVLDEAAEALAKLPEAPGALGGCDVTVHTFLGSVEAPEMRHGWQDLHEGSFSFGRPRFFPLILIFYKDGQRVGEYTDAVTVPRIAAFFDRWRVPRGGHQIEDAGESGAAALTSLLGGAGPVAVGCGLSSTSNMLASFDGAAQRMHGRLVFARAPKAACEDVLGLAAPVVWARGGSSGAGSAVDLGARPAPESALANATSLAHWLGLQRHELLDEMTPDNSHKYIEEGDDPLAIFLVDADDTDARARGEALFAAVETELHSEADRVQLVWSDCKLFGDQFDAVGRCPVVVLVDPETLDWVQVSLAELEVGKRGKRRGLQGSTATSRLLGWLQRESAPWRRRDQGSSQSPSPAHQGRSEAQAAKPTRSSAAAHRERKRDGQAAPGSPAELLDIGLLDSFQSARSSRPPQHPGEAGALFDRFCHLRDHLLKLRESCRAVYSQLPLDFSALDKAQKLHPQMRSLAETPDAVRASVGDTQRRNRLWADIEAADEFRLQMGLAGEELDLGRREERRGTAKGGKKGSGRSVSKKLAAKLQKGWAMLEGLFVDLYMRLQDHIRGAGGSTAAPVRKVERRNASSLSVREFLESYAKPGLPVIITGLSITEEDPWTLEFLRDRCGHVAVPLVRRVEDSLSWGRLESVAGEPQLSLADFLDSLRHNETRRTWYLHDWSLPINCPAVFGPAPYSGFSVPKYFAGDYFQRAPFEGYAHSWPSLFVGAAGTESQMHIDSGGTNFWLYLLSGRKEWRFFSRSDLVNLYQDPLEEAFLFDVFRPDYERFPLARRAQAFAAVQERGELIFIPGGNPHSVRNLEDIHAVSMNYVDASNVWIFLWHALSNSHWRSFELFTDNITFPHGLRSDQQPLRFGTWKSMPWRNLTYDLW